MTDAGAYGRHRCLSLELVLTSCGNVLSLTALLWAAIYRFVCWGGVFASNIGCLRNGYELREVVGP